MTFSQEENLEEYVYHPINAFNLLKRSASIGKWIPKLNTSIQFFNSKEDSFALEEDLHNSHLGIAAINEYVDIDTNSIAKGMFISDMAGQKFMSNSWLTSSDLLKVADEARKVKYTGGYVEWLISALKMAKLEKSDEKYIKKIK